MNNSLENPVVSEICVETKTRHSAGFLLERYTIMLSSQELVEFTETIVQRDMDLTRKLLLDIEGEDAFDGTGRPYQVPAEITAEGYSAKQVAYHLQLLFDAGLVMGKPSIGLPIVYRLTWQGHEFIDNIKSDDIWSRTKDRLSGLPGAALSVVVAIAESEIKKRLGLAP